MQATTIPLMAPLLLLLAGCMPAEVTPNSKGVFAYRTERAIVLTRLAGKPQKTLPIADGTPVSLAWSPDDVRLAFTCLKKNDRQSLGILDTATGAIQWVATHHGFIYLPRWSPDGGSISYAVELEGGEDSKGTELHLFRLKDAANRTLARNCGISHAWSPDGRRIVATVSDAPDAMKKKLALGALVEIDVASGKTHRHLEILWAQFVHVRYAREGVIALCAPRAQLPSEDLDLDKLSYGLFAFHTAGKNLVAVSEKGESVTYSADSPGGKRTLFVVSPKGEQLAGELYVAGPGVGKRRRIGKTGHSIFPFWIDEDRIGFHNGGKKGKTFAYDLRTGKATDISSSVEGILIFD